MSEVKLEDLMKKSSVTAVPDEVALDFGLDNKEVAVQEKEVAKPAFTPEDEEKIVQISNNIDFMNNGLAVMYGNNAQTNIAKFSDKVLAEVRVKDSGDVGDLVSDLVLDLRNTNFDDSDANFVAKFFNKTKNTIAKYLAQYDNMSERIDMVSAQLQKAQQNMTKNDLLMVKLQEENVKYFHQLKLYVEAGKRSIDHANTVIIPSLKAEVDAKDDQMAIQVLNQYIDSVNRFEKRIADLRISQTIATQTAPQIQIIRNNSQTLIDKIENVKQLTIPLWKSQMVMALGIAEQRKTAAMVKNVNDTTNEILARNAEKLRQTSVEVARESERSIVDIETVRKVNDELIATLQETTDIQIEGRKKRAEAEVELVNIETQLRDELRKTIDRRQEALGS